MRSSDNPLAAGAYKTGAIALVGATAVILLALAFEYIGGYQPCPLCLQQRWAYYAAIPALFLGLILISAGRPTAGGLLFMLVSIGFLLNAGLGVYHAGAEWKFWPGPDTCAALPQAVGGTAADMLKRLGSTRVVRCDEAQWTFLGLSFAGWNVISSMLLWITSQSAAFATGRMRAAT